MSQEPQSDHITQFVERIISGPAGFFSWEQHECVIMHRHREIEAVEIFVRCLANIECEGSEEVLNAIMEQRAKKSIAAGEERIAGYIDELYCSHCDKDTKQKVNDAGHERDSSNDSCECLECGWIKRGLTDEYSQPYIDDDDAS